MAPPAFGDLGRLSKDLFNKNYHFGIVKLDVKTKSPHGIQFTVGGVHNNDTGRIFSSVETKYNIKSHGIILKQKLNTDNILTGEITAEDYFTHGLKGSLSGSLAAHTGKRAGKLTCGYKSLFFNLNGDVDLDHTGAIFNGSGVFGHLGWLAGMKMTFDPTKNKLSRSNFVVGYQAPQFHVTGHLDDGQEFNCSTYHKLSDDLDVGLCVYWPTNSNSTRFGLGCHYKLDENSAFKAKVNSGHQLCLSIINRLRPGINLTISSTIDTKSFTHGGHQIGLGLDFEG